MKTKNLISIPFIFFLVLLNLRLHAQGNSDSPTIFLGYFAPYGTQFGGKIGMSFNIKSWTDSTANKKVRLQQLQISPQVGYFVFPSVQRNFLVNFETTYQLSSQEKSFSPIASIGLGYLLAQQREGGAISLATGDIVYEIKSLHYFVPTINLGFCIKPKKRLGYFLKTFYGRKISAKQENSALFGLETGLTYRITNKN